MKKHNKAFKRQKRKKKDSRHHIIPSSRGGSSSEDNIAHINCDLHDKFHALFANRTPEECIEFLVEYFFDGNYEYLEYVMNKRELLYLRGYYETTTV